MKTRIKIKSAMATALFAAHGCTGFAPSCCPRAAHNPTLHPTEWRGTETHHPRRRSNKRALARPSLNALPVLETLGNFFESSPYEAAFLTCAFKASAADLVAQIRQNARASSSEPSGGGMDRSQSSADGSESETSIEFQRTLSFLLYGGLYQGCTQFYIYNHLFPIWFGDGAEPQVVAAKVLFDMIVLAPLLPLPISYSIKSLIYDRPVTEGLQKYADDVVKQGLLLKYWSFWCPVQSFTFSVVPDYLRIPFMATFSFVWLIVLSTIANGNPEAGVEERDANLLDSYRDQIRERLGDISIPENDDEEKKAFAF